MTTVAARDAILGGGGTLASADLDHQTTLSRILHWVTGFLIFTTFLVGFTMLSTVGGYATLRAVHETLGVLILVVVVVVRVANRLTHWAPELPGTVSKMERLAVIASELVLYGPHTCRLSWCTPSPFGTGCSAG